MAGPGQPLADGDERRRRVSLEGIPAIRVSLLSESWEGDQDLETAARHDGQDDGVHPVCHADDRGLCGTGHTGPLLVAFTAASWCFRQLFTDGSTRTGEVQRLGRPITPCWLLLDDAVSESLGAIALCWLLTDEAASAMSFAVSFG